MLEVNAKNLYIKSWLLSDLAIEAKLSDSQLFWKRRGRQFFFLVTPSSYDYVLDLLTPLNLENGSEIRESEIDYVQNTDEEIIIELKLLYGENVILSHALNDDSG
jgi:hypothetical protein